MNSPEQRALAARLLADVVGKRRTTDQAFAGQTVDPLVTELVYGTLRHFFSLSRALDQTLHNPIKLKDTDIRCLLLLGLYQLHHLRIPGHAVVNETVSATRALDKPWAKGLVNAVLRRAPTPGNSLEHPQWMQRLLGQAYGDDATSIMVANNERAPMAVRINTLRIDPASYRQSLAEAGIASRSPAENHPDSGWGAETLVLAQPIPTHRLPGYAEGLVAVQDAGAQLTCRLLQPLLQEPSASRPRDIPLRWLDACAAPGGKFFHLLEQTPGIESHALDLGVKRMESLRREGERLGHTGYETIVGDATQLGWWDKRPFDLVLLDAPCSGSGTLRRHPDIKLLRRAGDLPAYTRLQLQLLQTLWQTLVPGGYLVYCTCSLFPAENDDVVGQFISTEPGARILPTTLSTGRATRHGWQLLPTDTDTDGFFFARIRKVRP